MPEKKAERQGASAAGEKANMGALRIHSEPFPQVLFSGVGMSLDASLSRAAGIRLGEERQQGIDMLLEKGALTLFSCDLEEDAFYFLQVQADGSRVERKVLHFNEVLDEVMASGDAEGRRFAMTMREAVRKPTDGVFDFYGAVFTDDPHWNRVLYRSVAAADGIPYCIVGYNRVIDEEAQGQLRITDRERREFRTPGRLPAGAALKTLVESKLAALPKGDKGTVFLIELTNLTQILTENPSLSRANYIRALKTNILADFRGEDVLGQISDTRFLLFICGHMSIDVIERRAERVIELISHVTTRGFENVKISVGVAATGSPDQPYHTLLFQAQTALETAKRHGENNYRVFFEEERL